MSHYPSDAQTRSNFGPSMQEEGGMPMSNSLPGGQQHKSFYPRNMVLGTGILLLMMLCLVPMWNAASLMSHFNYTFWVGAWLPRLMLSLCVGILILYTVIVLLLFSKTRSQAQTEQTMMMVANIFVMVLGLALMLVSMPLSRQAVDTYSNLMYRCDHSEQTHRVYEYSQVLHNIRSTPGCATKYTVEECPGFEEAVPYTTFLKEMEGSFRCSGFCYRRAVGVSMVEAKQETSLDAEGRHLGNKVQHQEVMTVHEGRQQPVASKYPPTLFSDANFEISCEGMAARDMKNFAGNLASQTFYQGIYLLIIAIATGFVKLMSFCTSRSGELKGGRSY